MQFRRTWTPGLFLVLVVLMGTESYRGFIMLTLLFIMDLKKTSNIKQQIFLSYIMILRVWEDSWRQFGYFVKNTVID